MAHVFAVFAHEMLDPTVFALVFVQSTVLTFVVLCDAVVLGPEDIADPKNVGTGERRSHLLPLDFGCAGVQFVILLRLDRLVFVQP